MRPTTPQPTRPPSGLFHSAFCNLNSAFRPRASLRCPKKSRIVPSQTTHINFLLACRERAPSPALSSPKVPAASPSCVRASEPSCFFPPSIPSPLSALNTQSSALRQKGDISGRKRGRFHVGSGRFRGGWRGGSMPLWGRLFWLFLA